MPSSITLTVSHLPTSASFFQSALQPLNYGYRGHAGKTIGFGPTNSQPSLPPADFWITQAVPGVPAGAAHVAFAAPSRAAVHDFFAAALKAGGKAHGEPCQRDASGYYSAAVIDFDGNSIEAVYRPVQQPGREYSVVCRAPPSSTSKSRSVAVSRAPSRAPSRQPSPSRAAGSGDALDRILDSARNTADVARSLIEQVRPQVTSSNSAPAQGQSHAAPSDAIVGTLLGVAAGAALHYVFASRNSTPEREAEQEQPARPRLCNRSLTEPVARYDFSGQSVGKSLYSRRGGGGGGGGKYITLEDNDCASTLASQKSVKRIQGPPSSYKPPTVISQAQAQLAHRPRRSSSVSGCRREAAAASSTTGSRRRSSSVGGSAGPGGSRSVRQVTEIRSTTHSVGVIPAAAARSTAAASASEASFATARSHGNGSGDAKTSLRLEGAAAAVAAAGHSRRSMTPSVVGRLRAVKRLHVGAGAGDDEVRPDDSVSQVGSTRASRSSRRR